MSDKACVICGAPHLARGWCGRHYRRWWVYGDPLKQVKPANGEVQRYYDEVVLTWDSDDCLLWPYSLDGGYPALNGERGHVLICEETHGPKPDPKMHAAHWCGVRRCINRRHLRWATSAENEADKRRMKRVR
jgi:HNH endonuclease